MTKFWHDHGIRCFDRWTVPYFLEQERKYHRRPCLRLNHPDGVCGACHTGSCRYDKVCFICGKDGHGGFQRHMSGKAKGKLRCLKYRKYLCQVEELKALYRVTDADLKALFKAHSLPRDFTERYWRATSTACDWSFDDPPVHESVETEHCGESSHSIDDLRSKTMQEDDETSTIPSLRNKGNLTTDLSDAGMEESMAKTPPASTREDNISPQSTVDLAWSGNKHAPNVAEKSAQDQDFLRLNEYSCVHTIEILESDDYTETLLMRFNASSTIISNDGVYYTQGIIPSSSKGVQRVSIRSWERRSSSVPGLSVLYRTDNIDPLPELKLLRQVAKKSANVARIWNRGLICLPLHLFQTLTFVQSDLDAVVVESSALGDLSTLISSNIVPEAGFSLNDVQSICVHLIDGLFDCHHVGIVHRNLRPENILITTCSPSNASGLPVFLNGLVIKLTNFTPRAVSNLIDPAGALHADNIWTAPEIMSAENEDLVAQQYEPVSDLWSLGLLIYFVATRGALPFASTEEVIAANKLGEKRGEYLDRHGLQKSQPMLFDLIERLIRPIDTRFDLESLRCHPFLWSYERRKGMLLYFADAVMIRGSDLMNHFISMFETICLVYVFGEPGWVPRMAQNLLQIIPANLRAQQASRSGVCLLQAIKNILQHPERLVQQHTFLHLSPSLAAQAFVKQITDFDFPRLLVLLYELSHSLGKWSWDGDEVSHTWRAKL